MFKAIKDGNGTWNPTFNKEVVVSIRGKDKEKVLTVANLFADEIVMQQEDDRNLGLLFYAAGFDGDKQIELHNRMKEEYGVEVF